MSTDYEREIEAAHAARVARLCSATGWLSLVGKIFLSEGTTELVLPDGQPAGVVTVRGKLVELDGRVLVSDKDGRGEAVDVRGFALELMERGETLALRVRDRRELPRPFAGIARFPIDPAWRKRARLIPHAQPKTVVLDFEAATAAGGVTDVFESPGRIVFEHDGAEQGLEVVWEGADKKRLLVLFRDATSGNESYGLGRLVYAPTPDTDGGTVLDFNRTILPGCAFTVYATCPLASRDNHLPVAVRAGERFYEGPPIGQPV